LERDTFHTTIIPKKIGFANSHYIQNNEILFVYFYENQQLSLKNQQ